MTIRGTLTVLAALAIAVAACTAPTESAPPGEIIDGTELLAMQTRTSGPPGWYGANRFVQDDDWSRYLQSLASNDGQPHPIAEQVPTVPAGKVALHNPRCSWGLNPPDSSSDLAM